MTQPLDKFANQLDWNLLRTFVVIVQERSITQAAHRLFLTQPSVSGSLRRLEERIGQRLVERGGATQFRVTEAGESLYRACVEIYGTVRALPEVLDDARRNLQGTLALRVSSHIHSSALMRTVAEFGSQNPKVNFMVGAGTCTDILDDMRRKGLDLAVVSFRSDQPMLEQHLFAQMPMGLYAAQATTDLKHSNWIDYDEPRPNSAWDALDHYRIREGLDGTVVAQADSCTRMAELISHGLGIGFLPCQLAESRADLRQLPTASRVPELALYVTLQRHARPTTLQQRFIDAVMRVAQQPSSQDSRT